MHSVIIAVESQGRSWHYILALLCNVSRTRRLRLTRKLDSSRVQAYQKRTYERTCLIPCLAVEGIRGSRMRGSFLLNSPSPSAIALRPSAHRESACGNDFLP